MSGGLPGWVTRFVDRWDMPWMVMTVAVYFAAVAAVPIVFPDVSGVFIAVLILVGGFTSSVGTLLAAVKADKAAKQPQHCCQCPKFGAH
jgi:predicted MFS family arabinose efflux permease